MTQIMLCLVLSTYCSAEFLHLLSAVLAESAVQVHHIESTWAQRYTLELVCARHLPFVLSLEQLHAVALQNTASNRVPHVPDFTNALVLSEPVIKQYDTGGKS